MIQVGEKIPAFELKNQAGEFRSARDYEGNWLVLYVYPKDDTPGCTIQGKSFTEQKAAFERKGVRIVGLSADTEESHRQFCDKYSFTIELLADPEAKLLRSLGVGQSEYKGVSYWNRSTVVVDPKGVVRKVYENVKPDGHEAVLLRDLESLQSQS
jgi:peroxiredoxin Q/BCP